MPLVLVTDAQYRKALTVVRSLGRRGLDVVCADTTSLALARFSRYSRGYLRYPSPTAAPDACAAVLLEYVRRHDVAAILPTDDAMTLLLAEHASAFQRHTGLALARPEVVRLARDKACTAAVAETAKVPAPRTWCPQSLEEVERVAAEVPYPCVIKPRESAGARGIVYPRDRGEYTAMYSRIHAVYPWPIVQEMIPQDAPKYHVGMLLDAAGTVRASFVQRVVRQWPVRGGVGTFWTSVAFPELEDLTLALLRAMNWYGLALVEFLIDPRDDTPKLMEVNPRFWNTLALAVQCGVDFPYLLYRLATGDPAPPARTYALGRSCQWLLPGDALHFGANPHRWRDLASYLPVGGCPRGHVIWAADDPLPLAGLAVVALTRMSRRGAWRYLFRTA